MAGLLRSAAATTPAVWNAASRRESGMPATDSAGARRHAIAGASVFAIALLMGLAAQAAAGERIDLTTATIVVRDGVTDPSERIAPAVLQEEVLARTGIRWPVASGWPSSGAVIAIGVAGAGGPWPDAPPVDGAARKPEGYRLLTEVRDGRPIIWVLGADGRGALFGAGRLLRALEWEKGRATLASALDIATAPYHAIRGHQLGYRHHSNTYDGWSVEHYDRYIRELALFGVNAIENIPFQDTRVSPLMPLPREVMNRRVSEICAKYGLDYWLWTPADYDLTDTARREEALAALERLFADLPRLDALFVPGGDPGDNPASLVIPYLADLAVRLQRHHPDARVWLSLQHFDRAEIDQVFEWLDRDRPEWFGGLVAGPGSPPIPQTRARLHRRYRLRDYPDITHTVRCQYPIPWWDPALAFTHGREPVNPRPLFYAEVHDRLAPHTDGFISYSDGVNDDFNKVLWSLKSWDRSIGVREIAVDYARTFFGPEVAELAADALLALERNWEGPLATNGAVDGTLALWQQVEARTPSAQANWRLQMHLMRAYYDAYTRHRLLYETALEREANAVLATAPEIGASAAIDRALAILGRAVSRPVRTDWRARIEELADALFTSIRMQTSVPKHSASGYERGAVLDFVDHPLNNRWWLEDELAKVRARPDEHARVARLVELATWSDPGPGSFYDDVGNVAGSLRVRREPVFGVRGAPGGPIPHFTWEGGPTRTRLSWLTSLRWPSAIVYEALDPSATYVVRLNVIARDKAGDVRLRLDGQPAMPTRKPVERGELYEFAVPAELIADGRLELTFDPIDESHLNWREHSRLAEAWLIRTAGGSAEQAGARFSAGRECVVSFPCRR